MASQHTPKELNTAHTSTRKFALAYKLALACLSTRLLSLPFLPSLLWCLADSTLCPQKRAHLLREPLLFLCTHPLQLCCPSPVSLYPCIESLAGLEGEKSPRPLSPHPTAVSSWCFTFLLLVSLPRSTPSFSFCLLLPQFLSLLWLTPSPTPACRRLARWAGASCSCK